MLNHFNQISTLNAPRNVYTDNLRENANSNNQSALTVVVGAVRLGGASTVLPSGGVKLVWMFSCCPLANVSVN